MILRATAAILLAASCAFAASPLTLWYNRPAPDWNSALPVGNGRLGAMVFGGVAEERIQFNEHTVWTGEPHDYARRGAHKHLQTIRDLLVQGRQKEAEDLAMREFMSDPIRQKAYQPFGDILLRFTHTAEPTAYRRSLDLDTATAAVEYKAGDVQFRREVIASYPAQVLVVRLTASQPGSLSFDARLASPHAGATVISARNAVTLAGQVAESAIRLRLACKCKLTAVASKHKMDASL